MSKDSDYALKLIASGRLDEASRIANDAVKTSSSDWHAHYAAGQCFRYARNYPKACAALSRANELAPQQPSVLLALAIAHQLNGEYELAVDALRLALEIDADYAVAYNTLGMTQKLMGAYEKSAHNYDAGAQAIARMIVKSLQNWEGSPRLPHWQSRNDIWSQYAISGAINLAAHESVDCLAWPTGEMAERDARTQEFKGWYWQDTVDVERKTMRLFLPNYFNTFCSRLRGDALYAHLVGNRSTVLRLIGNGEEADRYMQEAEDFTSETAGLTIGGGAVDCP